MFDYHVHTTHSIDCATPMMASCEAAVAAGVTEIAFTDHVDHQPADMGFGFYKPAAYFAELDEMRERFRGKLTILAGAEVDYHTDTRAEVESFMRSHGDKYDFVIGSVHYGIGGEIIFPEFFDGKDIDDVLDPYFNEIADAVSTGWFDTIGHLDLPKRYRPNTHRIYEPGRYKERLKELFSLFIDKGVAFEINTSGIRQRPKSSMPGPSIVRWYVEAGGRRITTGTDSHAAQTVGAGVQTTLAMLQLCGLEIVLSFRGREGHPVPIADLRRP